MKTSAIILGVFTLICAIFVSCSKDDDELFVPASPTSSVSPTSSDAVEPVKNPGFLPDSVISTTKQKDSLFIPSFKKWTKCYYAVILKNRINAWKEFLWSLCSLLSFSDYNFFWIHLKRGCQVKFIPTWWPFFSSFRYFCLLLYVWTSSVNIIYVKNIRQDINLLPCPLRFSLLLPIRRQPLQVEARPCRHVGHPLSW